LKLVGRPEVTISLSEVIIEIIYTTSQSSTVFISYTSLALIQVKLGYPFPIIQFFTDIVFYVVANYAVKLKFCWSHELAHSIKPLYTMVHYEHHVCRGIYPSTCGAGQWEIWFYGGNLFFSNLGGIIPWYFFQIIQVAGNFFVHTMWSFEWLTQWHTLHHTVLADFYAVNLPSSTDKLFSKSYKQHHQSLSAVSPFIRIEWLSDVVLLSLMILMSLVMHYYFKIGLFHDLKFIQYF